MVQKIAPDPWGEFGFTPYRQIKKREGLNACGDRTLVTVRKDFGLRNGLKILIGPMTVI